MAGGGDWHGVSVDHAETLLENGPLGLGRRNFLFSVVTNAVVLEVFVNNENGSKIYFSYNYLPQVVNVFALESLRFDVDVGVDFSAGDHGQVSINIKGEGTETADVDTLASPEVVVKVGDQGSPDNQHLSFGFNRLLNGDRAFGGVLVLSRILILIV